MTDVVTGSRGFIGSHLVEELRKSHTVWGVDLKEGLPTDIRKEFHIPVRPRTIFHLAALADIVPSIENPEDYFHTNVTGTLNALQAARKAGAKKFIYAASASCYGVINERKEAKEDFPLIPAYPYALTKILGENLVMHWAKVYGMNCVSLRLFNVYGPRSRTTGTYGAMFGTFLAQLANDKPLTVVGDGNQSRDFIYVSDVVEAFIMAADNLDTGIYNVGSGKPVSVNRIVELLGAKDVVHIPERPGEPYVTCADISKIKDFTGWEPKVPIEQGIAKMLEHLSDYKNAPLWTPDTIADATKSWFKYLS